MARRDVLTTINLRLVQLVILTWKVSITFFFRRTRKTEKSLCLALSTPIGHRPLRSLHNVMNY